MYSRSYTERPVDLAVPESYGGVALTGGFATEGERAEESAAPSSAEPLAEEKTEQTFLGGIFNGFLQGSGIGRLGSKLPFLQKVGSEEILIILAALFLFFSKEGDKECAAALILLLFIT